MSRGRIFFIFENKLWKQNVSELFERIPPHLSFAHLNQNQLISYRGWAKVRRSWVVLGQNCCRVNCSLIESVLEYSSRKSREYFWNIRGPREHAQGGKDGKQKRNMGGRETKRVPFEARLQCCCCHTRKHTIDAKRRGGQKWGKKRKKKHREREKAHTAFTLVENTHTIRNVCLVNI